MSLAETSYVRIHPLPVRVTHWINALAILVMVLGINLVGDALRDLLDPQMKTVVTG